MKNITDPSDIASVVVFRALNLGDMLCAVPALRGLRRWLPAARITYVGLPWSRRFAQRFARYIDDFVEFPGYPGLPERLPDIRAMPAFLGRLQERGFDLAIQMHGSGNITTPLVALFGASVFAGFFSESSFVPDGGWAVPYPEGLPEIRRCLKLMEALGAPPQGEELEFPLTPQDGRELEEIPAAGRLAPGSYIVVHPGSKARTRRWTPEGFAAACDGISEGAYGTVITGSAGEWHIAESVRRAMKGPAVNLAGLTTVGALAVLVKNCRLLVCNDTGISHIAAALKTPSVVVFTASDPVRWQPLDERLHATISRRMPCAPCEFSSCPIGHPCCRQISPGDVIREGKRLLNRPAAVLTLS